MKEDDEGQRFLASARAALDRSVEDLDPRILARLRTGRCRAMEASPRPIRWWLAGGVTAALAAGLAAVVWWSPPANHLSVHDVEELELSTTVEAFEFYDELEFYRWLATHDGAS